MVDSVQFFINNEPRGASLDAVPLPNVDDVIEVDGVRYLVRMVIRSYSTTRDPRIGANVYLEPVQ
jgi:hypothetical protein